MSPRRLAVVLVLAAFVGVGAYVVLSGTEPRDLGPPVADPLAEALGFAPARSPVLAALLTDPETPARRDLATLADRFPAAELARAQLDGLLRDRVGLGERDLRPLLGNPVIAWAPRVGALRDGGLAWIATDGERLEDLLEERREDGRLQELPPDRGFRRYSVPPRGAGAGAGSSQAVLLAVRGQRLVAAPDPDTLADAIIRHVTRRGGASRSELRTRLHGVDLTAVLTVVGQAGPLVAQVAGPEAARGVPWLRAVRDAVLTLDAEPNALQARARITTPPGAIRPQDLPVARGPRAPVPRGRGALVAGVRAARQTVAFARQLAAVTRPDTLGRLDSTLGLLRRYAGVDLQRDLIDRLTGTTTFTTDAAQRWVTARAELDDPGPTADALDRLRTLSDLSPLAELAGIDTGGLRVDEDDGRFTVVRDGTPVAVLGIRGRTLVASTDPRVDVDAVAAAPPVRTPVRPGPGALQAVAERDAAVRLILGQLGLPAEAEVVLTGLGAPVLSVEAELDRVDLLLQLPTGS